MPLDEATCAYSLFASAAPSRRQDVSKRVGARRRCRAGTQQAARRTMRTLRAAPQLVAQAGAAQGAALRQLARWRRVAAVACPR